jgi:hypothetical protein
MLEIILISTLRVAVVFAVNTLTAFFNGLFCRPLVASPMIHHCLMLITTIHLFRLLTVILSSNFDAMIGRRDYIQLNNDTNLGLGRSCFSCEILVFFLVCLFASF